MKRLLWALALSLMLANGLMATDTEVIAGINDNTITLRLSIPTGMYSYVSSPWSIPLAVAIPPRYERYIGMAVLPQGKAKDDEVIVKGMAEIILPIMPGVQPADLEGLTLSLRYQLCDEVQNVCLPPKTVSIAVALSGWTGYRAVQTAMTQVALASTNRQPEKAQASDVSKAQANQSKDETLTETLARLVSENIDAPLFAFLLAFLGGFLASLTPCVYPVIPVTLAFFAGREGANQPSSPDAESLRRAKRRRLTGALLYVAGMGLVYTTLGLVAGLAGGAFGSIVSTPPFFIGVALLFIALALSLFDVWELRMPAFVERLKTSSARPGGGAGSALAMGAVTGLVASPCVGPLVFFILTGVMQRGEPIYGAFLMVGFSLGIGLLFLVLALASGRISRLPKSGNWMIRVKMVLGALVLMSGLYFLGQAVAGRLSPLVLITLFIGITNAALVAGWYRQAKLYGESGKHGPVLGAIITLALIVFLITQGSGLIPQAGKAEAMATWNISLDEALARAGQTGLPVFVDVGATWCTVCRELKSELAKNDSVRGHIERHSIPVYVDYDAHGRRMKSFGVTALPWVMLLDSQGRVLWKKSGFDRLPGLFAEISNTLPFSGERISNR